MNPKQIYPLSDIPSDVTGGGGGLEGGERGLGVEARLARLNVVLPSIIEHYRRVSVLWDPLRVAIGVHLRRAQVVT